jgi:hypothetical protein
MISPGPSTTRQIAETLLGPFSDVGKRKQAEAKIRIHLRSLAYAGVINGRFDEDGNRLWRSLIPPDPRPIVLGMSAVPEPKTPHY